MAPTLGERCRPTDVGIILQLAASPDPLSPLASIRRPPFHLNTLARHSAAADCNHVRSCTGAICTCLVTTHTYTLASGDHATSACKQLRRIIVACRPWEAQCDSRWRPHRSSMAGCVRLATPLALFAALALRGALLPGGRQRLLDMQTSRHRSACSCVAT